MKCKIFKLFWRILHENTQQKQKTEDELTVFVYMLVNKLNIIQEILTFFICWLLLELDYIELKLNRVK